MKVRDLSPQELLEQPQLIQPEEFGLDDPRLNRKLAAKLIRKSNIEILWQTERHMMAMTGRGHEGYYILYDREEKLIDYLVRYETQRYNFIGHYVTQVAIWRNMDRPATVNLSKKIFFENILPMRGIVVSDRQQTDAGRRFWIIRMTEASQSGMKVGLIDIHRPSIDWCPEGEIDRWLPEQMKFWGPEKRAADFRFIISTEAIGTSEVSSDDQ